MILHPRELLNLAGVLTMTRLPLALWFPFVAHDRMMALGVYGAALLTDALDGVVARATGTVSETGAFMDGWMDKIFHVQAAWAMALAGVIPGWWMLLWFARELVLVLTVPWYIHRYVSGETPPVHANPAGKVTSVVLGGVFIAALAGLDGVAWWGSVACGVLGASSGVGYLRRIQWGQWVEGRRRPR